MGTVAVSASCIGRNADAHIRSRDLSAHALSGEILAMIDPTSIPSQNVAKKLGSTFWKQAEVDGFVDNLYRVRVGQPHSA